jgi:hypothetical protein
MTLLQFIASIVNATAWPIVVLVAIAIFGQNIQERIGTLSSLKWGDKSIDFDRKLDKIENEAVEAFPVPDAEPQLGEPESAADKIEEDNFQSALDASPRLAVIGAWLLIEDQLQKIGRAKGYDSRTRSTTFLIRRLFEDGFIDKKTFSIINELRILRNDVMHRASDSAITVDDALRYRDLSDSVVRNLQGKI